MIYVDATAPAGGDGSSWVAAYTGLSEALTRASASAGGVSEIRVAGGVYRPGTAGNRAATFVLVDGVACRGSFAGLAAAQHDQQDAVRWPTTLSGDLAADDVPGNAATLADNAYHVVRAQGLQTPTVLDNFYITGGNASGADDDARGGGVFVSACGAGVIFSRCRVGVSRAQYGGGIFVQNSTCVLSNCIMAGNSAVLGGGVYIDGTAGGLVPRLEHCTIAYNTATIGSGAPGLKCLAWSQVEGVSVPARVALVGCIGYGNSVPILTSYTQQFSGYFAPVSSLSSNATGWAQGSNGNLTGDPLFIDPLGPDGRAGTPDDNLGLSPASPAIDTGPAPGADAADVDRDGDTAEPCPLDFAGGVRTYDEPGRPGTGADMGTLEGPAPGPIVTPASITASEGGGPAVFTVRLTRPPSGTVTLTVLPSDRLQIVGLAPAFDASNWDLPQNVSVLVVDDDSYSENPQSVTVSAAGHYSATVEVVTADNDTPTGIIYVKPSATGVEDGVSWNTAFRSFVTALNFAATRPAITQVWIAGGSYRLPNLGTPNQQDRTINIRQGLTLLGGFAGNETAPTQRDLLHTTTFHGDLQDNDTPAQMNGSDNTNTVFTIAGGDAATGLDGITLRYWQVNAVEVTPGADPTIGPRFVNCRFYEVSGRTALKGNNRVFVERCQFIGDGLPGSSTPAVMSDAVIADSSFTDLLAGALRTGIIDRCTFVRAAINNSQFSGVLPLIMRDCTLTAAENRGLMALSNSNGPTPLPGSALFERCNFLGAAGSSGPGLPGAAVLRYCLFENHTRGALKGGTAEFCTFRNNSDIYNGGAAFNSTLTNCRFENNSAGGFGGAAAECGPITDCVFINNHARAGGAIFNTNAVIRGSVFQGNWCTAPFDGGSSSPTGGGAINGGIAVDCAFYNNTSAADGGAVREGKSVRCRFGQNSAAREGGAGYNGIYIDCLVTGNTAGVQGGGLSAKDIEHCTIVGNSAPAVGGVFLNYNHGGHLVNSIVWGNTAATGTIEAQQVACYGTQMVKVDYADVSTNTSNPGNPWSRAFVSTPAPAFFIPLPSVFFTVPPPEGGTEVVYFSGRPAGNAASPGGGYNTSWVSTATDFNAVVPSFVSPRPYPVIPPAYCTDGKLRLNFAADDQLGDNLNAGVWFNGYPVANTVGGSREVGTYWVRPIGDLLVPAQNQTIHYYVHNEEGWGGFVAGGEIVFSGHRIAGSDIQGLGTLTTMGCIGQDPLFVDIAGPDGVMGTADDDPSVLPGSPVVDGGLRRWAPADSGDSDSNGNAVELLPVDLFGTPRRLDMPLVADLNGGLLPAPDMGAVEVTNYEAASIPPCPSDVGRQGGLVGHDWQLDNNDFVVYIGLFFLTSPLADVGSQGGVPGPDHRWDNNDFIVFIDRFFAGCGF